MGGRFERVLANRKCVLVTQLCLTLCDPMDCSPPGFSVQEIVQARMLEWVPISFCRGSSQTRNQTWVSYIAGGFFTVSATREPQISSCFISFNLHIVILQMEKPRITESNWVH